MTQCNTQNSRIVAGLEDPYTIFNISRNLTPGTQTPSHPPTPIPMSSAHQSAQPKSTHIDPTDNETPDETLAKTLIHEEAETLRFIIATINSSSPVLPCPIPSSGNPIHSMDPTPRTLYLHFSV